MICEYGCGKEGNFIFKNKKYCCSKYACQCAAIRQKNSKSNIGKPDKNKHHKENKKIVECSFCNKRVSFPGLKSHTENCYLNPKNKKLCPVCEQPIKNFKTNKTCSSKCGTLSSRRILKKENDPKEKNYRKKCFSFHGKQCIICKETLVVAVHHLDGNRTNNNFENIIPLCPTHHEYCHHLSYWFIIKECVEDYIKKRFKGDENGYKNYAM